MTRTGATIAWAAPGLAAAGVAMAVLVQLLKLLDRADAVADTPARTSPVTGHRLSRVDGCGRRHRAGDFFCNFRPRQSPVVRFWAISAICSGNCPM